MLAQTLTHLKKSAEPPQLHLCMSFSAAPADQLRRQVFPKAAEPRASPALSSYPEPEGLPDPLLRLLVHRGRPPRTSHDLGTGSCWRRGGSGEVQLPARLGLRAHSSARTSRLVPVTEVNMSCYKLGLFSVLI